MEVGAALSTLDDAFVLINGRRGHLGDVNGHTECHQWVLRWCMQMEMIKVCIGGSPSGGRDAPGLAIPGIRPLVRM